METYSAISQIGNTPLVRLKQASELTGCNIYGKAEYFNPGESVKDRAALFIVEDAIKKGGEILTGGNPIGDCFFEPTVIGGASTEMKFSKDILNELWAGKFDIDEIIRSKNIEQVSDTGILMKEAQKILEKHPKEVQDYKNDNANRLIQVELFFH